MLRALDKWCVGYLRSLASRPRGGAKPRHLIFCVADHFEPFRGGASRESALRAVRTWVADYPAAVQDFRDADGKPPQHTFFYPQEEYDADCLARLAALGGRGYGEVEIHLHHRHDTPGGLRAKLLGFRDRLHQQHGLLGTDREGALRYGFIHGNWALCNSRPDGDWCGVNDELEVLSETGCYADFTFPSAPSPTQPRMVNAIYYARDAGGRPRGGDQGVRCQVTGVRGQGAGDRCQVSGVRSEVSGLGSEVVRLRSAPLLLVTGPLALDWRRRKWGCVPRLENGALTSVHPPLPHRVDLWVRQGIHVAGRPEWVFVKVYTHGGVDANCAMLLGDQMRRMHRHLQARFNDGREWRLHYVTARELYNIVKAAEAGKTGDPHGYRDFEVCRPPFGGVHGR